MKFSEMKRISCLIIFIALACYGYAQNDKKVLSDLEFESNKYKLYVTVGKDAETQRKRQLEKFIISNQDSIKYITDIWKGIPVKEDYSCRADYNIYIIANDSLFRHIEYCSNCKQVFFLDEVIEVKDNPLENISREHTFNYCSTFIDSLPLAKQVLKEIRQIKNIYVIGSENTYQWGNYSGYFNLDIIDNQKKYSERQDFSVYRDMLYKYFSPDTFYVSLLGSHITDYESAFYTRIYCNKEFFDRFDYSFAKVSTYSKGWRKIEEYPIFIFVENEDIERLKSNYPLIKWNYL